MTVTGKMTVTVRFHAQRHATIRGRKACHSGWIRSQIQIHHRRIALPITTILHFQPIIASAALPAADEIGGSSSWQHALSAVRTSCCQHAAAVLSTGLQQLPGPGRSGWIPHRRKLGTLQWLTMGATFLSALALIWVSRGGPSASDSHRHIQLPYEQGGKAGSSGGGKSQRIGSLDYPLWWHAPFVANSGLGSEAIMIIEALISTKQMVAEDIYITHSGDTFDQEVLRSLTPVTRNILAHRQHPQQVADEWIDMLFPQQKLTQLQRLHDLHDPRRAIAVCHNWFDCWRRPGEAPNNMPGCPCPLGINLTAFTVARTMFETAGLPAHLADHVKAMDEVWVPTQFNKDSFAKAGVDPAKIRIVPEGIDTAFWDPALYSPVNLSALNLSQATGPPAGPNSSLPGLPGAAGTGKPFVFLSVFKWEARKGWKDLIIAFCRAFKPSEPVVLWILARPFMDSGKDFDAKVAAFAAKAFNLTGAAGGVAAALPRIYTSSQLLGEVDFVRVYKAVDALVIPTHGEGWGRPQIEAMAMELPVITTNWSGPTAFMNEQIAYPLKIDGLSTITDDGDPNFFQAFIGQQWAQPSVTHLTQLMRHVFTHRDEAAAKGKAARQHIEAHYTPKVVAGVVAAEIQRLQQVIRERERSAAAAARRSRGAAGLLQGARSSLSKKGMFGARPAGSSSRGSKSSGGSKGADAAGAAAAAGAGSPVRMKRRPNVVLPTA